MGLLVADTCHMPCFSMHISMRHINPKKADEQKENEEQQEEIPTVIGTKKHASTIHAKCVL